MQVYCSKTVPQFGFQKAAKEPQQTRQEHYNQHGSSAGFIEVADIRTTKDGTAEKVVRHADLNHEQAAQLIQQTMALQAAMLRHALGPLGHPPLTHQDTFHHSAKGKQEKHSVLHK
jgi:hypothetical protein